MKKAVELTDKELRQAYVFAMKRYNETYKEKKDLEEEMFRRYEKELDENREV